MRRVNAPKYTDEQRDAAAHAAVDRGLTPAAVSRLAAAGDLEHEGRRLEPFEMPAASVGTYAHRLKQRRKGRNTGQLAEQPPRDAVEVLRRRLVNLADRELGALERKKVGTVEPERIRQTARAVREIAALPGPTDPTPPAPGAKTNGTQHGAQTKGGLAGPLLTDHRATHGRGAAPTPNDPPDSTEAHEPPTTSTETSSTPNHDEPENQHHDDGTPGHVVRGLAAVVRAPSSTGS